MGKKAFWFALGVGAVAGGIVALLYAPQSGDKTRRQLRRGLEDAGEALDEAGDYLKKQADRLAKEAEKLLDSGKQQFDFAIDTANDYVKTAKKQVSRMV